MGTLEHGTWEPSQYVFKQILPWLLMWEIFLPSLCKTGSTTQSLLCMCVLCVVLCVSVCLCVRCRVCICVCVVVCVSVWCLKSVPQIGSLPAGISPTRISLHTQTGPCWCQIQEKYRNTEIQKIQKYRNTVQPAVHKHRYRQKLKIEGRTYKIQ